MSKFYRQAAVSPARGAAQGAVIGTTVKEAAAIELKTRPDLHDKFIPQIAAKLIALFGDCDSRYSDAATVEKILRSRMRDPGAMLLVIEEEGELKATISVIRRDMPDFMDDPYLSDERYDNWVADFASFDEGKGYGSRIFADMTRHLLDTDVEYLHLYTEDQHDMYARRGFRTLTTPGNETGWRELTDEGRELARRTDDGKALPLMAKLMFKKIGDLRRTIEDSRAAEPLFQ
jgi:hypothetical protein